MNSEQMRDFAIAALDDIKAVNVIALDVRRASSVTDYMLIASGTSDRHVRSIVSSVVEAARERGIKPLGVEGEVHAQWALVDLGDVIVHVMKPDVREFYQLEKLWGFDSLAESKAR
ncbi:MAG: ribosome silencing factor [Chromatiales bacterium]|jgi:ribosome-associated protein|nr:ribosome silencing factor [Chromatiales bacterium]